MKYLFISTLVLLLIDGCTTPQVKYQEYKASEIVHYTQFKHTNDISNHAFYLDKGDKVLVAMKLDSKIADMSDNQLELTLKKRVYFRMQLPAGFTMDDFSKLTEQERRKLYQKDIIHLSADAKTWAPYTDGKAIQQLFGINGGALSLGIALEQDNIELMVGIVSAGT